MKQAIAFLLMVFSLTAISSFAEERGGVGVGNGRSIFKSGAGFSVTYADTLTLSVHSDSLFDISNEKMVRPGTTASRVAFGLSSVKVASMEELGAYLERTMPDFEFGQISFPGARGFFHEERNAEGLSARYFLLTSNRQLVEVKLAAYEEGRGIELVAPIVKTFAFDITRSVIHEVRLGGDSWESGSRQALRVRATDDNSGILLGSAHASFGLIGENGEVIRHTYARFDTFGPLVPEGAGWYRLGVQVKKFLPPGRYVLRSFYLMDNAGNVAFLETEGLGQRFYKTASDSDAIGQPKVPVAAFSVSNHGQVDVSAPEYLGFREPSAPWVAGTWPRAYFSFRDGVSGIDVKKLGCLGLRPVGGDEKTILVSSACRNPRHEGGDWYSIEVEVGQYLPSGEYYLSQISASDRAGNSVHLSAHLPFDGTYRAHDEKEGSSPAGPAFRVSVANHGKVDISGPKVLDWRLSSHEWKLGTDQYLWLRLKDDVSGIAREKARAFFQPILGEEGARTIPSAETLVAKGNGWYALKVHVNTYLRPGRFFLQMVSLNDRARNHTSVSCWTGQMEPAPCVNPGGPPLPELLVTVTH